MMTDKKILKELNKKPKSLFFWRGYILDWVIDIAIASIIVYIIITFALQNMYVVGSSMTPTLQNGETVLIDKITYLIKKPKRNDLIAFKHTDASNKEMSVVKRIIGIPGDKIEMIDHIIHVNDKKLDLVISVSGNMTYPIRVPEDAYFVLGDNKQNSIDSRHQEIGLVPKEKLTGRVFMRIWPFWKIKIF